MKENTKIIYGGEYIPWSEHMYNTHGEKYAKRGVLYTRGRRNTHGGVYAWRSSQEED